jgi:tRNA(Arg) A34 adenosine deaminase TadA
MCLGAIYWARPARVYFGNTRKDAGEIGFDDSMIYDEITAELKNRKIPMIQLSQEMAYKAFDEWKNKEDKIAY